MLDMQAVRHSLFCPRVKDEFFLVFSIILENPSKDRVDRPL
ncbi:hypothetical protein GY50_0888 [Dehalococcoides mccartyi GY50]|nr:hypothetical protein GY50_0888 [Dehalococcoides mccartyi GY50]